MTEEFFYLIGVILLLALAIIPAEIAKRKGYSYLGYWIFGLCFFLPALIVVLLIPDKNEEKKRDEMKARAVNVGAAEEIAKYKKLLDDGLITEEEYAAVKKKLLGIS